jgi:hypothetical protein
MTGKTFEQMDRQSARGSNGRYAKHNSCECCGKPVRGTHYTISFVDDADWPGIGIRLHSRCCSRLEKMGKEAAMAALRAAKESTK